MATRTSLPPEGAFYHAILRHLAAHPEGDSREGVHEAMPDLLSLSEAQRTERLANLPHLRYRHRSGFGLSILKKNGYVESPKRGFWRITEKGRELLRRYPDGFPPQMAVQILREYRSAIRRQYEAAVDLSDSQTPDERIEEAVEEIRQAIAADLLERILAAPPSFFEKLVLDLLHTMGYGTSEEYLQHVGAPGDGGFDGIISLDRLGLEKVYVQAKRWRDPVGRPAVQAFFGALSGRRARKGVFMITSTFTREAREFGEQVADRVVLIDGALLTSLMIEHGVGVTHYRVLRLPRVDSDYFEAD